MFSNLEALATAMGTHIGLEFLTRMKADPGSFTRLAIQHGLSADVGIAAKREFIILLQQGAQMFAPAR